jgi:hypothetical protein
MAPITPDGLPRISFRRNDDRVKDGVATASVEMKGNPSAEKGFRRLPGQDEVDGETHCPLTGVGK